MKCPYRCELLFGLLILLIAPVAFGADQFSLTVPGKTIQLSLEDWRDTKDKAGFSSNYEEKNLSAWHKFGRMVTVFSIPMSDDRRIGLKISDREYLEFFVVHPGFVTAQTRIDKGLYWVLCRETFKLKSPSPIDMSIYKPVLSETESRRVLQLYQEEVDETRYILNSKF